MHNFKYVSKELISNISKGNHINLFLFNFCYHCTNIYKREILKTIKISDSELIELIKNESSKLDVLYLQHKESCINFMRKIDSNMEQNLDVYHDAVIVFYEKIVSNQFELTCSIQTYLNSICRNQLCTILKKSKLTILNDGSYDNQLTDWYDNEVEVSENKLKATIFSLEKLKSLGGKCFEILNRYYYENQSMQKIAEALNYTNADNVKNQKARCQKKLNEIAETIYQKLNE